MKVLRVIVVAALASLLTVPAHAADMKLIGTSGTENVGGYWAGFYTLTADGDTLLAMCDDFYTHVSNGDTWTANRYTYADLTGNPALAKFAPLAKYSQAGWLLSLLHGSSTSYDRGITNAAIWKIMNPSVDNFNTNSDVMALYNDATDGTHDGFDFSHVMVVWTPDPKSASQEFLQPVPEPATVLLFLSGISMLLLVRRRSR
jgi:hypothetical protein